MTHQNLRVFLNHYKRVHLWSEFIWLVGFGGSMFSKYLRSVISMYPIRIHVFLKGRKILKKCCRSTLHQLLFDFRRWPSSWSWRACQIRFILHFPRRRPNFRQMPQHSHLWWRIRTRTESNIRNHPLHFEVPKLVMD